MLTSPQQLPKIPAAVALQWIQAKHPVQGYHIVGQLSLLGYLYFDYPVEIENCWVDELVGSTMHYTHAVRLVNSHFTRCEFEFAYFTHGLSIEGCTFDSYLDFQAGGHNQPGCLVQLTDNIFKSFVNFFDCWYRSTVQIERNDFQKGTNLLGAPQGYLVQFDVPPLIQNNTGDLNRNDEGDIPS
ncbi:hypothetical protein [Hymenobacter wooponensis]|uniref:Right-handed parallel beta-helix repeat-containing protein n=1 Tax=Hymenobacter wooponensis TaxID=1525360 RepID=A0A4Z0MPG2_9BACT|nr:hypothetical protein [Hymenobacter wooponensis]TGD81414.1 hypothetical protein EU557_07590 [Hymenobacter wooponensis]